MTTLWVDGPLPFGCNCDPYDCGPASHDPECPAVTAERAWIDRNRRTLGVFAELLAEAERQDRRYGVFTPDVKDLRLAVAALEDEVEEVKRAWRAERKRDDWADTATEALQVAAVAIRLAIAARNRPP